MSENKEPTIPSATPVTPKTPAQSTNKKKIRIDPRSAETIASTMLANIIKVINSTNSEIIAEPGFTNFTTISGKCNEHVFSVEYIPRTRKQIRDLMHVSYDDYEFTTDGGDIRMDDFVFKIKRYIDENFLLDLNTWTYVPRPKNLNLLDKVAGLFGAKIR